MTKQNSADGNKQTATVMAFGQWQSSLTAEHIFGGSEVVSFLKPGNNGVFFLLNIIQENNNQVLMHLSYKQQLRRISGPGFNIRSRANEYGGLPYTFSDKEVFYCNFGDQCLYAQTFNAASGECGEARRLTPADIEPAAGLRFADLLLDKKRNRLLCVREDHRLDSAQPQNTLVAIKLDAVNSDMPLSEGNILYQQSDFVASPCLSPDGSMLAFQTWSHPNMPWDETQIIVTRLDQAGNPGELHAIGAHNKGSLTQPGFSPAGDLFFLADWNDWWNLYRIDKNALLESAQPEPLMAMESELCPPQWQFGQHNYDFIDDNNLLVSINQNCLWQLAKLDLKQQKLDILHADLGQLESVYVSGAAVFYIAGSNTGGLKIYRRKLLPETEADILFSCKSVADELDTISTPEHFSFDSANGSRAYGILYQPLSKEFKAPPGDLPPLLVNIHGGPTSSAKTLFNATVQFWTSRGFAVLDVNHRGSTGYGRVFRQSLYLQWGVVDIEDVIHAVQHLIARQQVAADKVAIRGGSAGGYAVLAALAQSDIFAAGCSYYGVSDLELLAQDTHKFESRYLDQLIGPYPETRARYQQRSPIHRIDEIQAPVLLLQGKDDRVVPPNQAETIYQQLRARNAATQYLLFAGEGHGFRLPANQIRALETELQFYRRNLRLSQIV